MAESTLKPCPFCGGQAWLVRTYSPRYDCFFVFGRCELCHAQGKAYTSSEAEEDVFWSGEAPEKAARAWNMRKQ